MSHKWAIATARQSTGARVARYSGYAPPVPATEADLAGRDPASVMLPSCPSAPYRAA